MKNIEKDTTLKKVLICVFIDQAYSVGFISRSKDLDPSFSLLLKVSKSQKRFVLASIPTKNKRKSFYNNLQP